MNTFALIIIMEMIGINTYITYICSKKKASSRSTLLSICTITIAVTLFLFIIFLVKPNRVNANGKGLFALVGFIYVIPLKYIFDQPLKHMIIIMSSSWIYTMSIFSLSFRIAHLISTERLVLLALVAQTLIYILTLPYFIKFADKTFIYILRNIENKMIDFLLVISLSWFILVFLLNYTFVEGNSAILEFIILAVIIGNAFLSYKLLYYLVSINNQAKVLSQITKIDTLTQLRNREGLYEDALKKIKSSTPFTMIFIDLDNFKSVNDCFGHAAGDAYLIEFARTVKEVLKISNSFYRLHGDEFVIIVEGLVVESLCDEIDKLQFLNNPDGVAFRGLSWGCSYFPADGDTLIDLLYRADLRMYQTKKERRNVNVVSYQDNK